MRNRYSYVTRMRRNERTGVLKAFIIILPFLIVALIGVGAYLAYRDYAENNPEADYPQSQPEEQFYTDEEQSLLVRVINENNPLTSDFIPELVQVDGISVNVLLSEELANMRAAAQESGYSLLLRSGYVSFDEQKILNRNEQQRLQKEEDYTPVRAEAEAKKTVPQAGCSESQTGLVVEFYSADAGDFTQSREYQWLLRHANEYGFVQRYPQLGEFVQNQALFRFVGVENAMKIRSFGMTLDEYSVYLGEK